MDKDLQEMLDTFKIRQVLERYCRGIDRLDEELVNSVYWPDAVDNHGVWKGPGQEFGAFIVPRLAEAYVATMHTIHQSSIVVSGNRAVGDTYCIAMHRSEKPEGVGCEFAYCRYADVFEKRGDEWRILDRTVLMEHAQSFTAIDSTISVDNFTRGVHGRGDLSYTLYGRLEKAYS